MGMICPQSFPSQQDAERRIIPDRMQEKRRESRMGAEREKERERREREERERY